MTRASIMKHAAALRKRYRKASRTQKTVILTEFCLTTRYHRRSAIRFLSRKLQSGKKTRRRRGLYSAKWDG